MMAKIRKFNWAKIGIACILLGIVLFSIGWLSGARGAYINFAGGQLQLYTFGTGSSRETPAWSHVPITDVTGINVNTQAADIVIAILRGDAPRVELINLPRENVSVRNGVLTINTEDYESRNPNEERKKITILLPHDTVVDIHVSSVYCDISVNNLDTHGVALSTVSGNIDMIAHNFTNVNIQSVSGHVFAWVAGTKLDYNVRLSTVLGVLILDGEQTEVASITSTGDVDYSITMESVSGAVSLTFLN